MSDQGEVVSDVSAEGGQQQTEQQVIDRGDGRTERGQFAPRAQHAEPAQQSQQTDPAQAEQRQAPPPGFIPQQAFDARMAKAEEKWGGEVASLRTQLDNALTQLRTFQQPQRPQEPPKPRPEFFDDPDAAFDTRLREAIAPITQNQQGIVQNFSKMMASDKHGEEAVTAAEAALRTKVDANPQGMFLTYQRIMQSPHPYGELVKWHKEQNALSTYGDDPEAAINAEVERRLAARMQQGNPQPPASPSAPPAMPNSFAGARNNGPRSTPGFGGPKPLSEIMGGR